MHSDNCSPSKFETKGNLRRNVCADLISSMLGPNWDGRIHVETKISSLNILWTIMRYVTPDDKDSGAVNYDQWNRKNVCQ